MEILESPWFGWTQTASFEPLLNYFTNELLRPFGKDCTHNLPEPFSIRVSTNFHLINWHVFLKLWTFTNLRPNISDCHLSPLFLDRMLFDFIICEWLLCSSQYLLHKLQSYILKVGQTDITYTTDKNLRIDEICYLQYIVM